jgi:hypothetical protein
MLPATTAKDVPLPRGYNLGIIRRRQWLSLKKLTYGVIPMARAFTGGPRDLARIEHVLAPRKTPPAAEQRRGSGWRSSDDNFELIDYPPLAPFRFSSAA